VGLQFTIKWKCGVNLKDKLSHVELRQSCGTKDVIIVLQRNRVRPIISGLHHYEWVAPLASSNLQSRRSWAILTASVNVRLWDSRSFSSVFIHVFQGRPRGLFQCSCGSAIRVRWYTHYFKKCWDHDWAISLINLVRADCPKMLAITRVSFFCITRLFRQLHLWFQPLNLTFDLWNN